VRQLLVPLTHAPVPVQAIDLDGQPPRPTSQVPRRATPVDLWRIATSAATTPTVLIDRDGLVVAMSESGARLLATTAENALGRPFLATVTLLDFIAGHPTMEYAERIPPLAAVRDGMIVRGLLRVAHGDVAVTVDAVGAPLCDESGAVVGSLSFFADIAAVGVSQGLAPA